MRHEGNVINKCTIILPTSLISMSHVGHMLTMEGCRNKKDRKKSLAKQFCKRVKLIGDIVEGFTLVSWICGAIIERVKWHMMWHFTREGNSR